MLPLSFDYGLYQLLMVFKFGGTLVLEKGFNYPAAILKRMEKEQVTGFPGVPTIFADARWPSGAIPTTTSSLMTVA